MTSTGVFGTGSADLVPVSSSQRRLWLLEQRNPAAAMFSVPMICEVEGALDEDVLARALHRVVARHEALRTGLRTVNGELVGVVLDPEAVAVPCETVDLTGRSPGERADAVTARAAEEAARAPDLAVPPPLGAVLLVCGPDTAVLLLTLHHALCDGASVQIVLDDLVAEYAHLLGAGPGAGPAPELGFADWVEWHNERAAGPDRDGHREYWRARLAGAPPLLELPTDRERTAQIGFAGAVASHEIGADVVDALRAVAGATRTSLFTVVLAGLAVVLGRHARTGDVSIGAPVSARDRPELDEVVGLLLHTVVLRLDVAGPPTVRELIAAAGRTVTSAVAHAELPFSDVVADLAPARDPGSTPLFQVLFTLEEQVRATRRVPGALLRVAQSRQRCVARNDLAISMEPGGDGRGLRVDLEYRTGLFDADRVERLLAHLDTVLADVPAALDRPVGSLAMLPAAERHRVLVEPNETARPFPGHRPVPELFLDEVTRAPDAVAVYAEAGELTYAELHAAASQLARRLRARGVGPESVVGVALPRSPSAIVALLGVLLAGGAYLALDPRQPTARLATILRGSRARLLVTAPGRSELAAHTGTETVPLETPVPPVPGEPGLSAAELPALAPSNLAYVLYTSGSTGVPNGVAVPHRALVRLVRNPDYCSLGPEHVHLQLSPLSFDASLIEIWGPLLNGGAVVVPRAEATFLEQFREGVGRYPVTTVLLISPQLPLVLDERGLVPRLRQVFVGGDVLSPRAAAEWLRRYPDVPLVHVYGPTEDTLFATATRLTEVDPSRPTVPIGRPITNTGAYVLDDRLAPAPVGVPGELYLSGEGLARVYLHDPARSARRFVAHPYGAAGERLYRTGDLARWGADGRIEFLGRVDDQIQIRGFRVELGEVAAALESHPGVAEAVASVVDGAAGESTLVGHVVAGADGFDEAAVLAHAAARLPHYMVPEAVAVVERFPLTANGKIDRRALPPPRRDDHRAGAAARTDTERRVEALWRETLDAPGVDRDRDFFDVGGNSVLLMTLYRGLDAAWPAVLRVAELFELTTVADQAGAIDRRTGETAPDAAGPTSFEL